MTYFVVHTYYREGFRISSIIRVKIIVVVVFPDTFQQHRHHLNQILLLYEITRNVTQRGLPFDGEAGERYQKPTSPATPAQSEAQHN